MKFPYAPDPHADANHPDFKVWTVQLGRGSAISTRPKIDSQPSDVALEKLKSLAHAEDVSIRESSVSGRPMWEEQEHSRGDAMLLERYVCGVGRFYVLTCVWPAGKPQPGLGIEIMDSFRLVQCRPGSRPKNRREPGAHGYGFSAVSSASPVPFSGRSCGNRITSRIVGEFVSSIASRSTPMPTPPAGGIPYDSARM